jgi:hypothetical protein
LADAIWKPGSSVAGACAERISKNSALPYETEGGDAETLSFGERVG